jgi:hypothetical protein
LCKENGYTHRLVQWMFAKRRSRHTDAVENRNSSTSMGSTSSEDVDLESPRVTQRDQEQGRVIQSRYTERDEEASRASTSEEIQAEKRDYARSP